MPIKRMDLDEFLDFLKQKQGEQTDKQFATSLGVSPQYLCDIYSGRRIPGETVVSAVNASRSFVYTVETTTKKTEEKK